MFAVSGGVLLWWVPVVVATPSIFRELQMDQKSTRQRTPRAGAAHRVVPDIGKVPVRHDVARIASPTPPAAAGSMS